MRGWSLSPKFKKKAKHIPTKCEWITEYLQPPTDPAAHIAARKAEGWGLWSEEPYGPYVKIAMLRALKDQPYCGCRECEK
jgi:hypothetical protein